MESLGASITCVNTWCTHMTTSPRMDYISTWAWAITILVTSLSMTFSATDWFCVSLTTQNQHWSSSTAFNWYPVLVTIQLQPPYQDGTSPFGLLGISNTGTGGRNRTFTNRVKVCCATTTQHPNKLLGGDRRYRSFLLGLWSRCASVYAISPNWVDQWVSIPCYDFHRVGCYHYTMANVKP